MRESIVVICPTRLGKNSFVCTDGRISMLFVGSNYLEASVTSSAQAIRGNCLLRVREVIEFLPSLVGQITSRRAKPVQPPRKKYFAFSEAQISRSVRTVPLLRGALRNVTDAERDAVDAAARLTGEPDADGKVVWS